MTEDVSSHHFFAGSELRELKSSVGENMAHTDAHTRLLGLCSEGGGGGKQGKANKREESGQKMEDADNSLKHICKICKKKFGCGRALGGHMRVHGPMAADLNAPDQKKKRRKVSEIGGAAIQGSLWRRDLHELNRASMSGSSIDCNNSEIEEPVMQDRDKNDTTSKPRKAMKRPRSRRPRYAMEPHPHPHPYFNSEESLSASFSLSMSKEDEDVANWLVMLSTAEGSWRPVKTEQIASGSDESKEWKCEDNDVDDIDIEGLNRSAFECRTCKKVFGSHQALGGHRARHNKVKGCCVEQNESLEEVTEVKHKFRDSSSWTDNKAAAAADDDDEEEVTHDSLHVSKKAAAAAAAAKVHECPICHRIFGSGQALGGHKRCHWGSSTKDSHTSCPTSCSPKHPQIVQKKNLKEEGPVLRELLDLNLPAPLDNDEIDCAQMGDTGEKPCNLLKSSDSNNISYYTQQWWINNQYPLFPLALSYDVNKGNLKDIHHRPWLQVATKTT